MAAAVVITGLGTGISASAEPLDIEAHRPAVCAYASGSAPGGKPASGQAQKGLEAHKLVTKKTVKDPEFYQQVYNAVAEILDDLDWDDGSWGPVLVRLAWHASGTYDDKTKTGGSNGATMRFKAEKEWGANAGLVHAQQRLEPIKAKFGNDISYADLWQIAGICAIQEMGGPTIKFRPGRLDADNENACPPDGRLPDASKKARHLRDVFACRMGFTDRQIVALSGAHVLGRCHTDRSGYDGPWTFSPTTFSNEYFRLMVDEKWVEKKWQGPKQYVDAKTGNLMMLPSDLALLEDSEFKPHVLEYAKNQEAFFKDFSVAFQRLQELGCDLYGSPEITFKRT
jgi:cytochrome c peroxidase